MHRGCPHCRALRDEACFAHGKQGETAQGDLAWPALAGLTGTERQ